MKFGVTIIYQHYNNCFKGLTKTNEITRLAFDRNKPRNLDFELRFWWAEELRMTQGHQLDHSLSLRFLNHLIDNALLEHSGLPRVLPISVHLYFGVGAMAMELGTWTRACQ